MLQVGLNYRNGTQHDSFGFRLLFFLSYFFPSDLVSRRENVACRTLLPGLFTAYPVRWQRLRRWWAPGAPDWTPPCAHKISIVCLDRGSVGGAAASNAPHPPQGPETRPPSSCKWEEHPGPLTWARRPPGHETGYASSEHSLVVNRRRPK